MDILIKVYVNAIRDGRHVANVALTERELGIEMKLERFLQPFEREVVKAEEKAHIQGPQVRILIMRLRSSLLEYFETEGRVHRLRLSVAEGAYRLALFPNLHEPRPGPDLHPEQTIAFISASHSRKILSVLTDGIEHECRKHGFRLIVASSHYSEQEERHLIESLAAQQVGGLIIIPVSDLPKHAGFQQLRAARVPFVLAETPLVSLPQIPCAVPDFKQVGFEVARYLLQTLNFRLPTWQKGESLEGFENRRRRWMDTESEFYKIRSDLQPALRPAFKVSKLFFIDADDVLGLDPSCQQDVIDGCRAFLASVPPALRFTVGEKQRHILNDEAWHSTLQIITAEDGYSAMMNLWQLADDELLSRSALFCSSAETARDLLRFFHDLKRLRRARATGEVRKHQEWRNRNLKLELPIVAFVESGGRSRRQIAYIQPDFEAMGRRLVQELIALQRGKAYPDLLMKIPCSFKSPMTRFERYFGFLNPDDFR